jgi:hypothetical protein
MADCVVSPALIARPTRWGNELRLYDASDTFLGICPADVDWRPKLDGPDSLTATLPRSYRLMDGTTESRVSMIESARYIRHGLHRYAIDRRQDDKETRIKLFCRSAEVELRRYYSNITNLPFVQQGKVPTDIMSALFAGETEASTSNADLTDWHDTLNILYASTPSLIAVPDHWESALDGANPEVVENAIGLMTGEAGSRIYGAVWRGGDSSERPTWTEAWSSKIMSWPEGRYRVGFEAYQGTAFVDGNSYVKVGVEWLAADASTVLNDELYDITSLLTTDWQTFWLPSETTFFVPKSQYFRFHLYVYVSTAETFSPPLTQSGLDGHIYYSKFFFYIDNLQLLATEVNVDSGWTWADHGMDTRDTDVLHTDSGWVKFGAWTTGVSNLYSTTVDDCVDLAFRGPTIDVHFAAGGAGATADVYVDYVLVAADLDVSAAYTLQVSGLSLLEHMLEVVVRTVKVSIEKVVVDANRYMSVSWQDKDLLECVDAHVQAIGGELELDTIQNVIHHYPEVGKDLTAANVLELRRGVNILDFGVEEEDTEIVNRLIVLGYGDGPWRVRITVDAQSERDGSTSQDVYGVQWGQYINTDLQTTVVARAMGSALVERLCWPRVAYRISILDTDAALCAPGDYVHVVYGDVNESLRILELQRSSAGGRATLIVGTRALAISATLRGAVKDIRKILRS